MYRCKRGPLDAEINGAVYGEGKWKVYKHKMDKRRIWRKLDVQQTLTQARRRRNAQYDRTEK